MYVHVNLTEFSQFALIVRLQGIGLTKITLLARYSQGHTKFFTEAMVIVRRARTAVAIFGGCVASLALVTGSHAGWTWPANSYLTNKVRITREDCTVVM